MKVSKEQASANRQTILETAARLYRERGFDGVGVAEITREAGFTHGGFYGHFESKEALAAEACELAFAAPLARLRASLDKHGGDARPYFQNYLRPQHRDAAGQGCPMPALAADAARAPGPIADALTRGIAAYLETLAGQRPDGTRTEAPDAADKARAILSLSALVGGMVLARATAAGAPALSDEILASLQQQLGDCWGRA
ncbi:TetR/AcrR family transcriptional regulator [Roseateles violae]|uniref:Helix-turn-helix domain-containing protein n=1 Tax=Roseateles violae TaxID=3058042 RepID=A0ABT8DYW4_9BURK|nr:TetR/AcrR family transcriptional regulator [Pelomonas sp. PFR6]MDN3922777.1 helix-turn-helix domain-containing protein [Pelomonas sp. PFR6]